MSLDTLENTGFEDTDLDLAQLKKELETHKADSGTTPLGSTFKGTAIGVQSELEKKMGLEPSAHPETTTTVHKPSATEKKGQESARSGSKTKVAEIDPFYNSIKDYKEGDLVSGMVTNIKNKVIFVDIAYKAEGIIEPEEQGDITDLKIGDKVSAKILRLENKAGNPVLSKKRADYDVAWHDLNKAQENNSEIEVVISKVMSGGMLAQYKNQIRTMIPFNQLPKSIQDSEDQDSFVGKTMPAKVLKVNRRRKRVLLTLKLSRADNYDEKTRAALDNIQPGQVLKGKVTSLKDYGAFVNLGEVDGLVHISEVSWSRIEKIENVLQVGQELDVYVIKVDRDQGRISLGLKQLTQDPWQEVIKKYSVGQKVKATISRIIQFGAFASIAEGIEGLIHITELSDNPVKYPEEAVKVGQEVEATIIRLDLKDKKLALSLKTHPEIAAAAPAN